jgi:hypothetical protein
MFSLLEFQSILMILRLYKQKKRHTEICLYHVVDVTIEDERANIQQVFHFYALEK